MSDEWVVLREHVMNPSLLSMDGAALALLSLETELQAQGIDSAFDPCRPGESPTWSRSMAQPFRLLVRRSDLARAQEVATALESEPAPNLELDDDFDDYGEPVE